VSQGYLGIDDAGFWREGRAAADRKVLAELRGGPTALAVAPPPPPRPPAPPPGEVEEEEDGPPVPLDDGGELSAPPPPAAAGGAEAEAPPLQLVLDAPRRVDLGLRQTLPAICLRIGPQRALLDVDLGARGFLVGVDQLSGELRWNVLGREDKAPEPVLKDVDLDAFGPSGEVLVVDAREKLQLPWRPGRLLLYAVVRERITAPCEVELVADGFHDEEVARFIDERRRAASPDRVFPAANARRPRYRPLPESPPVPDEVGVAAVVKRVTLLEEQDPLRLYGSFRLRVEALDRTDPARKVLGVPPGEQPTAIFPITLLVVGSRTKTPRVHRLRVPSYDPAPAEGEEAVLTGHFELGLARAGLIADEPQTLFVYVFSRGVGCGPFPIGLVDQAMIDGAPPPLPPDEEG
jgi:hypothetical protein